MTISTTSSAVTYQGNASNRTFTFSFPLIESYHLNVYLTDRGVTPYTVTLVDRSDYTLVDNIVTYPANVAFSPIPATKYITLKRVVPLIQERNFSEQSSYYLEDLESMGDYITQEIQQLAESDSRAVKVPIGSGKNPDTYLTDIETANTSTQQALAQVQQLTADIPALPFRSVLDVSANLTATTAHNGVILNIDTTSAARTITLPRLSLLVTAYTITIKKKTGVNNITVNTGFAGETIGGQSSYTLGTLNRSVTFVAKKDTLEWVLVGNMSDDTPFTDLTGVSSSLSLNVLPKGSLINADASGGALTLTLPLIAGNVTPLYYTVKRAAGTNNITFTPSGSDTINGGASYVFGGSVGDSVTVVADFTSPTANTWTVLNSTNTPLDASVTTAKIASAAVTSAKLDSTLTSLVAAIGFQAVSSISAATTLTSAAKASLINVTASTSYGITLPDISSLSFPFHVTFRRLSGASTITLTRAGTNTINGTTTYQLPTTVGASVMVVADPAGGAWYTLGFNA